jgi:hypothetical protein
MYDPSILPRRDVRGVENTARKKIPFRLQVSLLNPGNHR